MMTLDELEDIARVLRTALPDNSCRTQLGLILFNEMKQYLAEMARHYMQDGCPVCSGDCAGAMPPVTDCPIARLRDIKSAPNEGEVQWTM